jgi:hypothetical protein
MSYTGFQFIMQMNVETYACLLSSSWISTCSAFCLKKKMDGLWIFSAKICSGDFFTHFELKNIKERDIMSYKL